MSTLSLRLPDSLHKRAKKLAKHDHISVNQFVANAVAEKMAALETQEYLEKRAKRGRRSAFDKVLKKVANQPVVQEDQILSD